MKITIETIPHDLQRIAGQVGDWQWKSPTELEIRVSELPLARYEAAVAVHELVEALLCWNDRISTDEVDAFDMAYTGDDEPGDDPDAPYARQHCFATAVERMLIAEMGVSWANYEAAVEKL